MDASAEAKVIFYRLTAKFVDSAVDVPEEVSSIMYYTLSVGHHTGVADCFSPCLSCSMDTYRKIVSLVESKEARYKMEGIMRFGEIQVDKTHVDLLQSALKDVLRSLYLQKTSKLYAAKITWLNQFIDLLDEVREEPGMYLMGRLVDER